MIASDRNSGNLASEFMFLITRPAASVMAIAPTSLFGNYPVHEIIVHVERKAWLRHVGRKPALHVINKSYL